MWLISPIGFFLLAVVLHAAARRVAPRSGAVVLFFAVGGAIGVMLMVFLNFYYGYLIPNAITAVLGYSLLCELYVFVFTLALSSVSANLLVRVNESPSSASVLDEIFDGEAMVARRIDRMIGAGFVIEREGRLLLTPAGIRLLRYLNALRKFFKHREGTYVPPSETRAGRVAQNLEPRSS